MTERRQPGAERGPRLLTSDENHLGFPKTVYWVLGTGTGVR